jgi:alginate O-acetyltransferase complex protein AlgI
MQFISLQFFAFFIAVFLLAILFKESKRYYKYFLLVSSLIFYLAFGWRFFLILVANVFVNYFLLRLINRFGKKFLIFSIIVNVLFLGAFKYYNFGTDTLLQTLNALNIPASIEVLRILIPVGISFYTFRNIAHLVDVYKKEIERPSLIDFANYVTFFPQIMSGPIMRAKEFYTFLHNPTLLSYSQGRIITLILSGLLKKYVIASYLYSIVSGPFSSPSNYSTPDLLLAAAAYSIMIYTDFSGYSDIAIAISNLLGFDVQANFKSPYAAIGIKDFWSRWHISLSTWLKDYIYIPLGGSRKGTFRKYVNIFVTMFVSGLWHGAGLNFIVWGILHGVGSVFSHFVTDAWKKSKEASGESSNAANNSINSEDELKKAINKSSHKIVVELNEQKVEEDKRRLQIESSKNILQAVLLWIAKIFGWAFTFMYITFTWIFFNSTSMQAAINFISAIFTTSVTQAKVYDIRAVIVIAIVLFFNLIGGKAFKGSIKFFDMLPLLIRVPVITVIVYFLLQLGPETVPPFIYFNF